MKYEIKAVHVLYEENQIIEVAVLWVNVIGQYRGTYCTNKQRVGYGFIKPDSVISDDLIQMVARSGMRVKPSQLENYFITHI